MASVHIGRLLSTGGFTRTVAIKKLYPQFAKDPDFVAMFLDEARLAARIKHPNVVPTLDIVREGPDLLLVMDYVQGETLARLAAALHAASDRLDPRLACAILVGILHGLHAAHEAKNEFSEPLGIVHRDVSSQNILVGVDGVPRLVDFGVAKAMGQMQETRGHQIKGKLPYMAPEQLRGATVTRVTDVWAAAVVLWETLTAEPLFHADSDAALVHGILSIPIRNPSEVAPWVPAPLDAIVRKGLERDPSRRFATAREMATAIEQVVPLALPSEIAACVERACGETLAKRAEIIREIESTSVRRALPATPIVPSSEFIADALWADTGNAVPPLPGASPTSLKSSVRPTQPAEVAAVVPPSPLAPASSARSWGIRAGTFVVLTLCAFGASLLFAPWYAKRRAIANAEARGVSLSIDGATGDFSSVTFHGVAANVLDVPGAHATVSELEIELSWLRPVRATLHHAELKLDGPVAKTLALVALWYTNHSAGADTSTDTGAGVRVVVPAAHVSWFHAFGEEGRIDADEVTGELVPTTSTRVGDDFQFTTSKLTLTSKAGSIGPWRVDLSRDPDALNARVAFDPPVPDGPSAMLTRMTTGKTSMEINVPRSPLYRLGIPPTVLADLHQVPDQAELKLHYARTSDDRMDATFAATFFGLHAPPLAGPLDVKIAGSIAGNVSGPLDLQAGMLNMGPVRATLTGPIMLKDSLRATLAWKAAPIPCAQLLPKSEHAATDLAGQLGALSTGGGDLAALGLDVTALAQAAGFARTSGNLSASGMLVFDSSNVAGTAFTATAKNSCGLSLLGGR